jgi:hypothetical protein
MKIRQMSVTLGLLFFLRTSNTSRPASGLAYWCLFFMCLLRRSSRAKALPSCFEYLQFSTRPSRSGPVLRKKVSPRWVVLLDSYVNRACGVIFSHSSAPAVPTHCCTMIWAVISVSVWGLFMVLCSKGDLDLCVIEILGFMSPGAAPQVISLRVARERGSVVNSQPKF